MKESILSLPATGAPSAPTIHVDGPEEDRIESIRVLEDAYRSERVARRYWERHHIGWRSRLFNHAELRLCARALAQLGPLGRILDCPAGVGRFWPVLARNCDEILAIDASSQMLELGLEMAGGQAPRTTAVAQAQALPLPDDCVDLVFCSRLLHHVSDTNGRTRILSELRRVSSRYVVASLFLTGNYKSLRRHRKTRPHPSGRIARVFLEPSQIERELERSGLKLVAIHHKLRFYSPLATVVAEKV